MKKSSSKVKLIVIGGPTASGKTLMAINLAKEFNGEIINFDSRQVFKGMDIGTSKGKIQKKNNALTLDRFKIHKYKINNSKIVGYLFNIVNPDESFSLAQYQTLAYQMIDKISDDGNLPILVGGTGLYIDSVLKGYDFLGVEPDLVLRKQLSNKSTEELKEILKSEAPSKYLLLNKSDINNPRRLIRAIEISKVSDSKISIGEENKTHKIDFLFLYPKYEIEKLYNSINDRVDRMFKEGLVNEVKKLIKKGHENTESMKGMGYREVIDYINGEISLVEVKELIKQKHRNYAKRQITWFEGKNRGYDLKKFDFLSEKELIFKYIKDFLSND